MSQCPTDDPRPHEGLYCHNLLDLRVLYTADADWMTSDEAWATDSPGNDEVVNTQGGERRVVRVENVEESVQ